MAIIYGIMLFLAVVLLVLYCLFICKKEKWMLVLFSSICLVNLGYLLLALSTTVEFAIIANDLTYLGQIFLLVSMYLTIAKLCGFNYTKRLPIALISIGVVMFAIVCTTGMLPWYYTSVSIKYVDGATKLIKEYGPLHVVYLIYVLAYFVLMMVTIIWSICAKKVAYTKQSGLLTAVVLCNIAMWLIEKFTKSSFEFLSVSYVLSEGMLFFLFWLMQDYVYKGELATSGKACVIVLDSIPRAEKIERVLKILPKGKKLTVRQMEMLEGILDGKSQKEIANDLNISENTVKWHTGLLYGALNVSGRDELFRMLKEE